MQENITNILYYQNAVGKLEYYNFAWILYRLQKRERKREIEYFRNKLILLCTLYYIFLFIVYKNAD